MNNVRFMSTLLAFVSVVAVACATAAQERARPSQPVKLRPKPSVPLHRPFAPARVTPKPVVDAAFLVELAGARKPEDRLTPAESDALDKTIELLLRNEVDAANNMLAEFLKLNSTHSQRGQPREYYKHIFYVSYLERSEDLKYYAEKVRFYNAQKEGMARFTVDLYVEGRGGSGGSPETIVIREPVAAPFVPGGAVSNVAVTYKEPEEVTKFDIQIIADRIELKTNMAEEEAESANVDLRNAMQKHQQMINTMSKVLNMFHDTADNITRNVR